MGVPISKLDANHYMPAMKAKVLSELSEPEYLDYNIADEINATYTRLRAIISEEANVRKTLGVLFVRQKEEANEAVRKAQQHLALVNDEQARMQDVLRKETEAANTTESTIISGSPDITDETLADSHYEGTKDTLCAEKKQENEIGEKESQIEDEETEQTGRNRVVEDLEQERLDREQEERDLEYQEVERLEHERQRSEREALAAEEQAVRERKLAELERISRADERARKRAEIEAWKIEENEAAKKAHREALLAEVQEGLAALAEKLRQKKEEINMHTRLIREELEAITAVAEERRRIGADNQAQNEGVVSSEEKKLLYTGNPMDTSFTRRFLLQFQGLTKSENIDRNNIERG